MIARALALLAVTVAGIVIGIVGGFVQSVRWVTPWAGLALPWGAVLAATTALLAVRGAIWLLRRRSAGWLALTGWVAGTFVVATRSPSGDLAISSGTRQWAYVLAVVVLGAAAATFPIRDESSLTIDRSGESTREDE